MIALKKPRSCKNCELLENNTCILNFPTERNEVFPFLPYPTQKCYKVTSVKDYMTVIRFVEVYKYGGV